jgi:hypothetical protein
MRIKTGELEDTGKPLCNNILVDVYNTRGGLIKKNTGQSEIAINQTPTFDYN